jgi:hypothetical protein
MATESFAPDLPSRPRMPLVEIDAAASARLGRDASRGKFATGLFQSTGGNVFGEEYRWVELADASLES